jgi:eukaryotic-like serine/threonine-protein kinase
MTGTILGNRYELLEKIGEGGMAEVYKARCHKLNRFDAVKILKKEFSFNEELVEKFKREATAVANLSDNNIINIFDVGSQDNVHYIVMEYVKGKTLKQIIRDNVRLNYEKALDISIQIARALDCAHRSNIIHRDVKPQNILVTEEGVVKVTDFGIAKAPTSVTITNTNKVMGSAHYFSPEQAKGNIVDFRTDIYSLGIVLYEMATGRVPYDADSPVSVALKHIQEPVVPPRQINSAVPESLNRLILKAIEKDPNMRYQNIKEMLNDMIRIQKDVNAEIVPNNIESGFTRIMEPVSIRDDEDEKEDEDEKNGISRRTRGILIFSLSAILVLALGALSGWAWFNKNRTIKPLPEETNISVPTLVGLDQEEAKQKIVNLGLQFSIKEAVNSDRPEGEVLESDPIEGAKLKSNDIVSVIISSGLEKIKVPDLSEYDTDSAKKAIKINGLAVGKITEEFSDTVPADTVISQDPEPGVEAEVDTKIDLVVSKGPEFRVVPDLVGKSLVQAETMLKNVKLVLGAKVAVETEDKSLDGKIKSQSIEKDAKIKENQSVSVEYYKYVEPKVTVPGFVGLTVSAAKNLPEVINKQLVLSGLENAKDTDIIETQDKNEGEQVIKGTKIILTVKVEDTTGGNEGDPDDNDDTETGGNDGGDTTGGNNNTP